jgi:hypothetical protein
MRWTFLYFVGLLFSEAAEMEVRKYRLSEAEFQMAHRSIAERVDDAGIVPEKREWLGKVVQPTFTSRFLIEGGAWRDCSKRVAEILWDDEFGGVALMDREKGSLVMKAEEVDHENFARLVSGELPKQIRMMVEVYLVPGVVSGVRPMGLGKKPESAKLLGGVSVNILPGQTATSRTTGGEMVVETEAKIDANDDLLEARMTLTWAFVR